MHLQNFIKAIFFKEIPRVIGRYESGIARLVMAPHHFNKRGELKAYSFTPPRNSNQVSMIRLYYCNCHKAKNDGIILAKQLSKPNKECVFNGLAIIDDIMINQINQTETINARIVASPIDKNNNYIMDGINVFTCDKGKPYHADLEYNIPVPDGEPSIPHQKYIGSLLDLINEKKHYFKDECPQSKKWCGEIKLTS